MLVYLAFYSGRIVLRIVVDCVRSQLLLKYQMSPMRKGVMIVSQNGAVHANDDDTVGFGSAIVASVGRLEWWGKDSGANGHGVKGGPVFSRLWGMHRSMASIHEASDSTKHVRPLGLMGQNTTCVIQIRGGGDDTCGGIVAANHV